MFDIKPYVLAKLEEISGVKDVSDAYPSDFNDLPVISFYEIDNSEGDTANPGVLTKTAIVVDIWHNRSTGQLARQVNEKLNELGLQRKFAKDIPEATIKHKTMRFEGTIDSRTLLVHQ